MKNGACDIAMQSHMQTKQTDKKFGPLRLRPLDLSSCIYPCAFLLPGNRAAGFVYIPATHIMGKTRPHKKKASKLRQKSAGDPKMNDNPPALLEQAIILLQTGRTDEALTLAQQALELAPGNSPSELSALNLLAEIYVELGEVDSARDHFIRAVELDPNGTIPESEGGGAEKFLWLAQLSEDGGADSVRWFEKGISALRQIIQQLEEKAVPGQAAIAEEKKRKLANALCGVAEIYMTDLS